MRTTYTPSHHVYGPTNILISSGPLANSNMCTFSQTSYKSCPHISHISTKRCWPSRFQLKSCSPSYTQPNTITNTTLPPEAKRKPKRGKCPICLTTERQTRRMEQARTRVEKDAEQLARERGKVGSRIQEDLFE